MQPAAGHAFKAAVDQGIRVITQGNGSGVAHALVDAVNKHNERNPDKTVLYLNYAAVDPELTNAKCSFWHFRFDANSDQKMQVITNVLAGLPAVKKVYLIGQDYAHGHQVAKAAVEMLKAKRSDVQIVGNDLHPIGKVKDFAPYVAKIQTSGADVVITGNWGNDVTLLIKAARDGGLSYEKVRLLSRLPDGEIERWVPKARDLTCVALEEALDARDEAQMRAARILRARVPVRIALLLQAAFRAVRATEGRLLDDGSCLVRVARHFVETWKPHVKKARTLSQKVRERDLGRCQVPACSRRAVHAHHIIPRARGGSDDPANQVALCACHHLRGIHGGYIRVQGRAPDELVWEVAGRVWTGGELGSGARALDA